MTNHVHLVVTPPTMRSLSDGIGVTHQKYARWLHMNEGEIGHSWKGRFHAAPMDLNHFVACIRYVEQNPLRAGIVKRAEDFRWSSVHGHSGVDKDELLAEEKFSWMSQRDWIDWINESVPESTYQAIRIATLTRVPTWVVSEELSEDDDATPGIVWH